ncbi:cytochrome C biogenesis protein [Halobacteriales archaeon QS_8_69_26]|nr:MAG: cytochrome C biogenesis protein [Halobacteriales archaeon QS_8_69_26]
MLQALDPGIAGLDPRIGFAFLAGVATFFAPCAYPLLPGYVAFFVGSEDDEPRPVPRRLLYGLWVALATSLGFFVVYALLAGTAAAVGTRALRNVSALELVVGTLLVVLGLGMATGRLEASTLHVRLPERRRSVGGYFLFGVVYAAAAAGCTAPVFIGVATFALSSDPATALAVFAAYAGGMSLLMLGVTVLASVGRQAVLRPLSGRTELVTRLAGAALVLAGLWQIYFFVVEFRGLETLGIL